MADDRMWLKCKVCGEAFCLGKTYLCNGYFSVKNPEQYFKDLMAFYGKHAICVARDNKPSTQTFELIYETDEDFHTIKYAFKEED